jgi:ribosome-binding protein aMBF1 (putative translation factor)
MPNCVDCGSDVLGNYRDDVDITCPSCTLGLCRASELQAEERLAAIDIEAFVIARKAHGWTQQDLALKLRLPQSHVSAFERGVALPSAKLADWFESEVD